MKPTLHHYSTNVHLIIIFGLEHLVSHNFLPFNTKENSHHVSSTSAFSRKLSDHDASRLFL